MMGGGGGIAGAALREAAARGDVARLVLLLKDNPKIVNESDENGCTALQRSAADGHSEAVALLLQNGADPNKQDTLHGNTALHEAAWKGYSRCARLLAAQADMHLRNRGGFAPLHLACQNGHNQTCREILLAGCDPDIQNNYGDTSLHTSARYGHAGVTRILISAECRVSDQNKNGDSSLHIAAAMGRRKLTRILLEAGSNKVLKNKQSETPKDIAVRKDLTEIIDILNSSSSKPKKDSKKEKSSRAKSSERAIDTPDGVVDFDVIRKVKERESCLSPGKNKDKKKNRNVHFENMARHWSPYGCHYYPDPKNFPKPNLDSLPKEPLKKGEQYYLDLAGNICKGPVGVGYTCYCAPFFRHMEDKLNRDKQELKHHIDKAHERLDQKVTSLELKTQGQISELTRCVAAERVLCRERQEHLEQWLTRGILRASERVRRLDFSPKGSLDIAPLKRTKSLEMLDSHSKTWNIIKSFNDKIETDQKFRKSMRTASRSVDVLDGDIGDCPKETGAIKKHPIKSKSKETLLSEYREHTRSSIRSSDKSTAGSQYSRQNFMRKRNGSESSHSVTAEIHVKPNRLVLAQSPTRRDQLSESDEKYSSPSKHSSKSKLSIDKTIHENGVPEMLNESFSGLQIGDSRNEKFNMSSRAESVMSHRDANSLDGIESDGYIKISKHSRSDNTQENSTNQKDFDKNNTKDIENLEHRKSVQELVAKIHERQLIDEVNRISRSPTADLLSLKNYDGSRSRPLSPNFTNTPNTNWQNNSIPLSENTHFNTIEPINSSVVVKPSQLSNLKAETSSKPKKFFLHNLIPFPSRKMFNFHQKTDGNKSESSDEEDSPIRSQLEPGLMKNSNLLTTLPLPNYENMASTQNAQPQMPLPKPGINGHSYSHVNPVTFRSTLLPIPKDAYFHEIPNKQRLDNFANPRLTHTFHQPNHIHVPSHHHFNKPPVVPHNFLPNGQPVHGSYYLPNRNPAYNSNNLLNEMMHDHISREMSKTNSNHSSQLEISNGPNGQVAFPKQFQNQIEPNGHYQHLESTLPNGHPTETYLHNRIQNLAINTHLSELQSQIDRDSHNDSGYSTKVYGSSQGASPSLSGNTECMDNAINPKPTLAINRNNYRGTQPQMPHIGASSLV